MDELYIHYTNPDYPILCSMFDESDPGYTRGSADHFEYMLTEMLDETNDKTKIALINKELAILKTVSWVEVSD